MNTKRITRGWRWGLAVGAAAIVVLAFAAVALAGGSGPEVGWWVFGGGGGGASGGSVSIDSTLGQPVVGVSTGGSVSGCAGYWCAEQPTLLYLPLIRR